MFVSMEAWTSARATTGRDVENEPRISPAPRVDFTVPGAPTAHSGSEEFSEKSTKGRWFPMWFQAEPTRCVEEYPLPSPSRP